MLKLLVIFWTFFKIGLFTIGGGYAMIPMIESDIISKGWLTEQQLVNFMAISESTPGPFAINIATFIGVSQAGIVGAIVATFGVVAPSFIIILIVFKMYQKFISNKHVQSTMFGIKSVVIGLILSVAGTLIFNELFAFTGDANLANLTIAWRSLIIMAIIGAIMVIFKKKIHPILLIAISAVLGIIFYSF